MRKRALTIWAACIAASAALTILNAQAGELPIPKTPDPDNSLWLGWAASPQGRVFKTDNTGEEIQVRVKAKRECAEATQRTCNAIAVTESAEVVVIHCQKARHEDSFLGGSTLGFAREIAMDKAIKEHFDAQDCREIYSSKSNRAER